jgi:hypothetical protein
MCKKDVAKRVRSGNDHERVVHNEPEVQYIPGKQKTDQEEQPCRACPLEQVFYFIPLTQENTPSQKVRLFLREDCALDTTR